MVEGYRRPGRSEPAQPPERDPDDLDGVAFARRQEKRAAVEEQARAARVEIANRQLRITAAIALVLGLLAFGLASPMVGSGYHSRGLYRGLVLGPAIVCWAAFTLVSGTGGAETLPTAPAWVRAGQLVAPIVGAIVGFVLAEL